MNGLQARARVWTRCLYALVLAALTGPVAGLLAPLAHASSLALHVVATILAAALIGAYMALAVLLIVAVLRVVRPRSPGRRSPMGERGDEETVPRLTPQGALSWSHRPRHLGPQGTFSWSHPGTRRRYPWSYPGTTPPFCGTTPAVFVGPTVVLGPPPWSPRGPSFHTGNRPRGTTVVPALYLGGGDHPWSQHHADGGPPLVPALAPRRARTAPRAATGRRVGPGVRARGRRGTGTATGPRPPVVAPLAGSGEATWPVAADTPGPYACDASAPRRRRADTARELTPGNESPILGP